MPNSKRNNLLILLGILSILFEISLYFLSDIQIADSPIWILILVERIAWMILFFRNIKIRQTIYGRIMLVSLGIVLIGVLWKLEHLSGASIILALGVLTFCILAIARFVAKKEKTILGLSKLFLVLNFSTIYLLKVEHYPIIVQQMLTPFLFSSTIILYILKLKKDQKLSV